MNGRKVWKKEILVDSLTVSTDSTDRRLAKNKTKGGKGRKKRNGSEVEKGMLWARFITEAQRIVEFVHSCRLTIYNRPLLFFCLTKMIKRETTLLIFSFPLPSFLDLSLERNKRYSFSNFSAFVLTSAKIRLYAMTFNLVFLTSFTRSLKIAKYHVTLVIFVKKSHCV